MTSADPAHHLLIDSRRSWTEQEVWTTADRIAHQVRAECLHPASPSPRRFAVFAENAGEAVIAHVGGMRAGASVVAMSAHLNAADAAYMLDTGDVALVVAGPRTADAARMGAPDVRTATARR